MEKATVTQRCIKTGLYAFLCLFAFAALVVPAGSAGELLRNGNFSDGMAHWNVNPDISSDWDPLHQSGGVSLHPPGQGWQIFMGTVIYQNLNIGAVSNADLSFSMDLYKASEYLTGTTILVELAYVTGVPGKEDVKYLEIDIDNDGLSHDPDNPTRVEYDISMPTDASRLVKLSIIKESWGELIADNISLTHATAVSGSIPQIASLSAVQGLYGTEITFTGTNFGTTQGFVSIGGSPAGVAIQSWSDTSITATVNDPARSGPVLVVSNFVESDLGHFFDVTSPNYTIDFKDDDLTVVKGQVAEYLVRVDFHNDFETTDGITFSIDAATLPAGAVASFTPNPVKNDGGVLVQIDTSAVPAGDYSLELKANAAGTAPRSIPFLLEVVTIDSIGFYRYVDDTQTPVTRIDLTTQGQFFESYGLQIEAIDSLGNTWTTMAAFDTGIQSPLALSSSDPAIVLVERTQYEPNYYALAAGSANIVVTATDGTQAMLPVSITIGENAPQVDISLSSTAVSHNYTGNLTFSATGNYPLTEVGTSSTGMVDFRSTFLENGDWYDSNKSYASTFQLGNNDGPQQPGAFTVMFSATASDGTTSATGYAPLWITADPDLAQLSGGVRKIDDIFAEYFMLEFYDVNGDKVHDRDLSMGHQTNYHLVGIPTGTYRLKLIYWDDNSGDEVSQWYPGASSFEDAQSLEFTAGNTVENVYFLLKNAPKVPEPPGISFTGKVTDNSGAGIEGATVSMAENLSLSTTTGADGTFTLNGLPVSTAFSLAVGKDGYTPVVSAVLRSGTDINNEDFPFVLFTAAEVAVWGIDTGKGAITGRVWDTSFGSPLQNAVVSFTSMLGQDYSVIYPGGTTATAADGKYIIPNVIAGDMVAVTATYPGFAFDGRVFFAQMDTVSEGLIFGSSDGDTLALRSSFDSAMALLNAKDLDGFMAAVSDNYLDDGQDKAGFRAELAEEFSDPDYEEETYAVLNTTIDGTSATMMVLWNGMEAELLYFVKEGESWKLYGNQALFEIMARSGHQVQSDGTGHQYWVSLEVEDPGNVINQVTVTGDGITEAITLYQDTEESSWNSWQNDNNPFFGSTRPELPLTYTVTINHGTGEGVTETFTAIVTNFVDVYPTNLSPGQDDAVSGDVTFTFTPVPGLEHGIELNDMSWNRIWEIDDVQTQIVDGQVQVVYDGAPLAPGSYSYNITTFDNEDNYSIVMSQFTYATPVPVPDFAQAISVLELLTGNEVTKEDLAEIQDVNADSKIGFAELLYILQTNANRRLPVPPVQSISGNTSLVSRAWDDNDGFDFSTEDVIRVQIIDDDTVWNGADFIIEWNSFFLAPGVQMQDLGVMSLDAVTEVPTTGYVNDFSNDLSTENVYAFKLADGTYGVIQFTELAVDPGDNTLRSSFNYKWQPDGSINF
jgi:hypothetical protein